MTRGRLTYLYFDSTLHCGWAVSPPVVISGVEPGGSSRERRQGRASQPGEALWVELEPRGAAGLRVCGTEHAGPRLKRGSDEECISEHLKPSFFWFPFCSSLPLSLNHFHPVSWSHSFTNRHWFLCDLGQQISYVHKIAAELLLPFAFINERFNMQDHLSMRETTPPGAKP